MAARICNTSRHRLSSNAVRFLMLAIRAYRGRRFRWIDVERISGVIVAGGFTRQALMAHADIYAAYIDKKSAIYGRSHAPTPEQSLRAEVAGLRSALQKLRLQIAQYRHGAGLTGLSAATLDRLIDPPDRRDGQVKGGKSRRGPTIR